MVPSSDDRTWINTIKMNSGLVLGPSWLGYCPACSDGILKPSCPSWIFFQPEPPAKVSVETFPCSLEHLLISPGGDSHWKPFPGTEGWEKDKQLLLLPILFTELFKIQESILRTWVLNLACSQRCGMSWDFKKMRILQQYSWTFP